MGAQACHAERRAKHRPFVSHLRPAYAATLALLLAACGEAVAPAPAPSRGIVISDRQITGELTTQTPGPDQLGGEAPVAQATQRAIVGAISFQTQTPSPTPPYDVRDVLHDPRFNPTQPIVQTSSNPPGQASIALSNQPPSAPTPVPGAAAPGAGSSAPPTPTPQLLGGGQSVSVNLPAGTQTCNTSQLFTFTYPGDSSNVVIDAQLNGLDPSNAGNAGLNVWDSTSNTAPVAKATTLTNQKNSVPGSIELNYSRPIAGQVTIELYNWAAVNVTGTVTASTLASNNAPLQVGALRKSC